MATTSNATVRIHRPYSHKHQPRRINLQYIAEMSFFASSTKKIFKTTLSTDDVAQTNVVSTSTSKKNGGNMTKSNPTKPRSPRCWSWLTEDKDFDGIIETTKPFGEHHAFSSSRNPLLCIVKIPNLKKATTKIISRKKKIASRRGNYTFPPIDQAKPILGGHDNVGDIQEADSSIDPLNIDTFIRDAGWDENLSVVEMHEWLPTNQVSLQLFSSESDSVKRSFEQDDASLSSFDLEAFNANNFSDNNVFRWSDYEVVTTPSTAPDTSFFSQDTFISKDGDEEESNSSSQSKSLPAVETTSTENTSTGVQELLNITQSNSFDTVEFYEEEEERVADSDSTSAYFSSDNLAQVHPQIVPSVSSSVASSIRGSEIDDLLSIPSFPSSSSWDGDDDDEEDIMIFEHPVAEIVDAADHDVATSDEGTTEAAYFSCMEFGGFLMLMF